MGATNKIFVQAIAAGITSVLLLTTISGSYWLWQSQLSNWGDKKTNLTKVPDVPQGIFRYGGSTSFAPLRNPNIVARIRQAHPDYSLVYTEPPPGNKPGSGIGIKMLIDGQLSFSQSSRPVKDAEYNAAKLRFFQLEQIPVAIDGIAIYINPQVSIPGLTVSQIKDIFTGKITNWQQINGPDLAITPISRDPKDGGTPEFFQETVLEKANFSNSVQPYIRDTTSGIKKVAKISGAIGYATASEVCDQSLVKTLAIARSNNQNFVAPCIGKKVNKADFSQDIYPITRRLFVVIKRDGKIDEKSGLAYANMLLTDEGQEIVNQVGLVPLHSVAETSKN
ncbi:PstS family phosphate ABC transporter substrate-binding protein [Nostoc sp. TCL26-01]|uniref:PstS family phosphate ABC transporter substrate-binding protein n=1 Tax=Nostoc sp. TCL26-01 TaxID=2576904 RepID=UPI0015C03278|nr:substrate-binding domain-containing protein [Nostoc sp. TCL26-01]QLE57348.1 hypothetical protein FD725_18570 [Nostoc sp. TCL26-01]